MRRLLAALLPLALVAAPPGARAEVYDVPIEARSEAELRDLLDDGDIAEDVYYRLNELLEVRLDPQRATRNELFDLPGLTWPMIDALVTFREGRPLTSLDDLVEAGVPRDVTRQLEPFVTFPEAAPEVRPRKVRGVVKLDLIDILGDERRNAGETVFNPAFGLAGRVVARDVGEAGVDLLVQDRVGPFTGHQEPGLTWLSADQRRTRPQLAKVYALADRDTWGVVLGTYQLGFGERLVVDFSDRERPDGFYRDALATQDAESARFAPRQRLFGVAGSLRKLDLGGAGELELHGFLSFWPYDINQTELDSTRRPLDDSAFDPTGANPLYCEDSVDPVACATEGTGRFVTESVRAAYSELLAGGRVAWAPVGRLRLGTTAYWARVDLRKADDLVFAPGAPLPNRDTFGAWGLDLQAWLGRVALSAEYALTFAGYGATTVRASAGWKGLDLELLGWWYATGFDNPHAGGTAAADERILVEDEDGDLVSVGTGQRDRDEGGGRLRLVTYPTKWLHARFDAFFWRNLSAEVDNLALELRLDVDPADAIGLSGGVRYTDKDLSAGGRDEVYSDDGPAAGAQVRTWLQVNLFPTSRLTVRARTTWTFEDDRLVSLGLYERAFRVDAYHWLSVAALVGDGVRLEARVKLLDEETGFGADVPGLDFDTRGERSLEAWAQARWRVNATWAWQLRYQLTALLDDRPTREADDLEHLVKAWVEARF